MKLNYFIISLSLIGLLFASCANDQTDDPNAGDCNLPNEVSFQIDIQPILSESCAYSGCHAENFGSGDFTTYTSLVSFLDDNKIQARALDAKDMPPTYAPDDKPKELTNCELAFLQSWVDAGYPNN